MSTPKISIAGPFPLSPEAGEGCKRAIHILTEMANPEEWWQIVSAEFQPLRWGSAEYVRVAFNLGQNEVTTEKLAWLQQQGWIAQVFRDRIFLAPLMFVDPPATCYHTTPVENIPGILENDLLTGGAAGRSTSLRKDCEGHIHVSFDLDSARKWGMGHLLGNKILGQEWGIIQINSLALEGRVFRDPASSTGYLLEEKRVAKKHLKLRETFRADQ